MRIGVDLGGTKIEAVALDSAGEIIERTRVATPAGDYDGTLEAIRELVEGIEARLGRPAVSVGIGTPGSISPSSGVIRNSNSLCLNGQRLDVDLARCLGRPIAVANDANCFALSEAIDGAGAGAKVVFGVIVGTGAGGGLVVRREVVVGRNGIAGEWGHMPLPWPRDEELRPPECYCRRRGCIETYLSGPGLARAHQERFAEQRTPREIVAGAEQGDARCAASLSDYIDRFARSLAVVIDIVDPDVIVLGGGMSNLPNLAASIEEQLPRWVFSDSVLTRIVTARYGDSSGVRGAAWLGPQESDSITSSGRPPGSR